MVDTAVQDIGKGPTIFSQYTRVATVCRWVDRGALSRSECETGARERREALRGTAYGHTREIVITAPLAPLYIVP